MKEPTATTIVEPGWEATVTDRNHLVLERVVALDRGVAVGTPVSWPQDLTLLGVAPNPFNPSLTIAVRTAAAGMLDVSIYNLLGERVAQLQHGSHPAGGHQLTWHPGEGNHELSSGLYLVRVFDDGGGTVREGYYLNR